MYSRTSIKLCPALLVPVLHVADGWEAGHISVRMQLLIDNMPARRKSTSEAELTVILECRQSIWWTSSPKVADCCELHSV